MALIKKSHKWVVSIYGIVMAFLFSLIGREVKAGESPEGITKSTQMPPLLAVAIPPDEPLHLGPKNMVSPPNVVIYPEGDRSKTVMEDSVTGFINSDIGIPNAESIMRDEMYEANPALYRLLIETMQMNILLQSKVEELGQIMLELKK